MVERRNCIFSAVYPFGADRTTDKNIATKTTKRFKILFPSIVALLIKISVYRQALPEREPPAQFPQNPRLH
jgi:hypothetical protein